MIKGARRRERDFRLELRVGLQHRARVFSQLSLGGMRGTSAGVSDNCEGSSVRRAVRRPNLVHIHRASAKTGTPFPFSPKK